MQNIEVSNAVYQKLMKYCDETGQCVSTAISRFIDSADESEKINVELLERDCRRAISETKKPISFEEVFDGV